MKDCDRAYMEDGHLRLRAVPLHNFGRLIHKQSELKARMGSVYQDYAARH